MKSLLGGLLIAVFIIGGWSSTDQAQLGQSFFQKIDQVNSAIDKENWPKAGRETSELRKMYQKKKWKIQLVGDEGEYEGLERVLAKLTVSVQEKEKSEAKMELSDFRALLKAIYSF